MDTAGWLLDTIEFDRAVQVAQAFARRRGDTLVIRTADHECLGAALQKVLADPEVNARFNTFAFETIT